MSKCYLESALYFQHPDSVDPIFDQSGWPEGTRPPFPYNTYAQFVKFVGHDDFSKAIPYDAAGLDAYLLYGGQFTPDQGALNASLGYLSIPWYLITGFDIQNYGFPPFYDDWVAVPEFSNTYTSLAPLVRLIYYYLNVPRLPLEVTIPWSRPDIWPPPTEYEQVLTYEYTISATYTIEYNLVNDTGPPPDTQDGWTQGVASGEDPTDDYLFGLLESALAQGKVAWESGNPNVGSVFSNSLFLGGGTGRDIDTTGGADVLSVRDYLSMEFVLPDFAWQGEWLFAHSVGTEDTYTQYLQVLDFDITESTNLITAPDASQYYLLRYGVPDSLTDGLFLLSGIRESDNPTTNNPLNYPNLGIDIPALQGVYPADFLDYNAIFPSPTYTNLTINPPPP